MVYVYTQDVPIKDDLYWKIIEELGPEPLAGSLLHLCVRREDGGLRYIEVWESKELCGQAFDERVHPAVDRAFGGARPKGEPTQHPLDVIDAKGQWIPAGSLP